MKKSPIGYILLAAALLLLGLGIWGAVTEGQPAPEQAGPLGALSFLIFLHPLVWFALGLAHLVALIAVGWNLLRIARAIEDRR